jgi:hypothetical protein
MREWNGNHSRKGSAMANQSVPHLEYGPAGYWDHRDPVSAIVVNFTSDPRRVAGRDFVTGRSSVPLGGLEPHLQADAVGERECRALGRIEPRFTGGECLPDCLPGETEIARISLGSTTRDVISVRARRRRGRIRYRMVDEYESPWECRPGSSRLPLTFGQLIGLLDSANVDDCYSGGDLTDALRDSRLAGGGDPLDAAGFVEVSSVFYPEAEGYYRRKADEWLRRRRSPKAVRVA